MDSQYNILIIVLLFLSILIWHTWQVDHIAQSFSVQKIKQNTKPIRKIINEQNNYIIAKNDVLSLKINTHGGDIEQAILLTYPETLDSKNYFQLLQTTPQFIYQAQSGLIGYDGIDDPINKKRPVYITKHKIYTLLPNQNELHIPLTYISPSGVIFTKMFILKRGSFALKISYYINNINNKILKLILFGQFKQSINSSAIDKNSNFALHSYSGAAYSTNNDKYKKYSLDDIKNKNLTIKTNKGWIAMLQKYFASAWIPLTTGSNTFYTNTLNNKQIIIGFQSNEITIAPRSHNNLQTILWLGPKIQDQMSIIAKNLDLTVDYGWLWFISQPLFKLLKLINNYIHNWGFAIIIITFIIRIIMYPLTKAQYTSIAQMRMLQPKLKAMRVRLEGDKQRQSQEMLALYRAEKVNPLGGCLPLIVQMPIFLALYYVLSDSVELRQAPFIMWIRDLSIHDPYYILPILMGITMLTIQQMSPNSIDDPVQKKIMNFMPIIFTVFFLWFPAGLVLYYTVSNLITVIQQQLIYRSLEKKGLYIKNSN